MKDNRKSLSECLPEDIFNRIHIDIGQASMCWEYPEKAGAFNAKKAADIAFELCHFIADAMMDRIDTEKAIIFIEHIKNHLKPEEEAICTICGKTIDEIYEEEAEN